MSERATRMEFIRRHTDDSGVEIGVIYDASDDYPLKIVGTDTISIDARHLDFMISALMRIQDEFQPKEGA